MDDDQNDLSSIINCRSPAFSRDEVNVLVDLVSKHKNILLNKCTNTATNQAKDLVWAEISIEINKIGFKHTRNADSLKTKWENLKKQARKASKNLMYLKKKSGDNDVIYKIIEMVSDNANINELRQSMFDDINDLQDFEENKAQPWDDSDGKLSDCSDEDKSRLPYCRTLNFAPEECSLLLKCIKDEKKNILCRKTTNDALKSKKKAWSRITENFNKRSTTKRTTKMLQNKFANLKKAAKQVSLKNFPIKNQNDKLENEKDDKDRKIKAEPHFEYRNDQDSDIEEFEVYINNDVDINGITNEHSGETSDPLLTVLKGDSGIDSISQHGCCRQSENNEVVKLKLELLKYKLETAKLERQRLVEAAQAESAERESRALEASLRLRAARLALAAAEQQLAPAHPALRYGDREARAMKYMQQFHD